MAKAAGRASRLTELMVGGLTANVGIYATKADPAKTETFDTAGPSGGRLRYTQVAVEAKSADPTGPVPVREDPVAPEGKASAAARAATAEDRAKAPKPQAPVAPEGEYRQVLVEEGTGAIVERDDVRRGVRQEDGSFVGLTPQLAAVDALTAIDRIEVIRTIDSTTVTRERVTGSYYLGAQDVKGADAAILRLMYEGLRERREAAVVKYTTGSRQRVGVVVAVAKCEALMLLDLVFADEFREAPKKVQAVMEAEVTRSQVEKMGTLLGTLRGKPDVLDELRDDAAVLRRELRDAAVTSGRKLPVIPEPTAPLVEVDFGSALDAAVEQAVAA